MTIKASEGAPGNGQPSGEQGNAQDQQSGNQSWYQGLPQDLHGSIQAKGWNGPEDVVASYNNLEKLLGADKAGRTLVIPKDDSPQAERDAFYSKLGRPDNAEGYQFKFGDGVKTDEATLGWWKGAAHKHGLSNAQAQGIAAEQAEMMATLEKQAGEQIAAQALADENALKAEWGSAFNDKLQLAKVEAKKHGVSVETVERMEKMIGGAEVLRLYAELAELKGEHVIQGQGVTLFGKTPSEAKAGIDEMWLNPETRKALTDPRHPSHKDQVEKLNRLQQAASVKAA